MSAREEAQEARIGIYLRLRPTPRPCGRVTADCEEGWVEFQVPKDVAQGLVNNSRESYRFPFDGVLPPEAAQDAVYDAVAAPVLAAALDGYSSTVFAYGQTGSGKTYTISGGTERYADRGLIPRALAALFREIAARGHACTYTVHLSYLEIYNEVGYDLLNPGREVRLLEDLPRVAVQEDEEGALHVRNLSLHRTGNEEEALNLLFLGDTNRTVAETPLNQASSRSHCMFSLHLEARQAGEEVVRRSRLNFVDLAGSERVIKTGLEGALLREAKHINLSLHFLEQVIVCLQERKPHVPYRNSLLTLLLRDSLGGNCRTVMIATVAPEATHIEESISTCRFAQRVAQISNKITRNEELDLPAMIHRLKAENQLLRQELQLMRSGGVGGSGVTGGLAAEGGETGAGGNAGQQQEAVPAAAGSVGVEVRRALSTVEQRRLQQQLMAYLEDPSPEAVLSLEASMLFISNAFAMLKAMVKGGSKGGSGWRRRAGAAGALAWSHSSEAGRGEAAEEGEGGGKEGEEEGDEDGPEREVRALRLALQQKQLELDVLVGVLHKQGLLPSAAAGGGGPAAMIGPGGPLQQRQQWEEQGPASEPAAALVKAAAPVAARQQPPMPITADMLQDRNKGFEYFCSCSPAHEVVQENKGLLRAKYEAAKALGAQVSAAKARISHLKSRLEQRRLQRSMDALLAGGQLPQLQGEGGHVGTESEGAAELAAAAAAEEGEEERAVRVQIEREKAAYRETFGRLKEAKGEVDELQAVLEHSRARLQRDFQAWWAVVADAAAGGGGAPAAPAAAGDASAGAYTEPAGWSIPAVPAPVPSSSGSSTLGPGSLATSSVRHDSRPGQQQQQQQREDGSAWPQQQDEGQQFAGWAKSRPWGQCDFGRGAIGEVGSITINNSSSAGSSRAATPRQPAGAVPAIPQPASGSGGGSTSSSRPSHAAPNNAPGAPAPGPVPPRFNAPSAAVPGAATVAAGAPPESLIAVVDPEVLAAARPLLTGNQAADADIIKFYQARAALLRSQVFA